MDVTYPEQLQRQFEAAIARGEHGPRGACLTVSQLQQAYGAALSDLRQVLRAAYRKGLVEPAASAGAEEGPETYRVLGLIEASYSSVFTHTAEAGFKPRSVVRDVEIVPATAEMAARLEVLAGSPVYRYVRTRYVDEEALANQINYMPLEVCPGLEHDDVSRYSFQKLLEGKYSTVFGGMNENFSLIPATAEDRTILGLPHGSSVLLIERVALSATNRPVVWANIRIRPDRYSYVAALWPEAAALLVDDEGRMTKDE